MKHSLKRILSLILLLLLSFPCAMPVSAAGETASVMKIVKTAGTVSITGGKGKKIPLVKNMNLYDGYGVKTDSASYAWISLDSTKLAMLDEVSGASVYKQGKKLEVMLDSGALFFNVEKPLEDDESLTIRTSMMALGIRGTSGWVRVFNKNLAQIYVLEGTVEVYVCDPVSGQMKMEKISGGETAIGVVYEQTKPGDKCDILRAKYNEEKVLGFVLSEVATHPGYAERIFEKSAEYVDLRKLTLKEAGERLAADQADTVRKLEQAQRARNAQQSQAVASSDDGTDTSTSADNSSITPPQPNTDIDADADTLTTPETPTPTTPTPTTPDTSDTPTTPTPTTPETSDTPTESGDGLGYAYNSAKKTLTISPDTETVLPDYEAGAQPWAGYLGEMERVVIADGITEIGNNAFLPAATRARAAGGEAANLTNVTLPASVTSIKADAFEGCTNIDTVYFGGTEDDWSSKVDSDKFSGMPAGKKIYYATGDAYYYYDSGTYTLTIAGDGEMGDYTFEELVGPDGDGVTTITTAPWRNHSSDMRKLVVEEGVTGIGDYAFGWCSGLTEITIPEGVSSIGDSAFDGCINLTEITIPEGVRSIGDSAFSYTGLTKITIPNSVSSIGDSAFSYTDLTEITIPEGVSSIGDSAFDGCINLTEITIPNSVRSIGDSAFSNTDLTEITIPEGVTSIGDSAFKYCIYLTKITIPNSVRSIGDSAFESCSNLTKITIPEGVTSIGDSAFKDCIYLTEITIPNSVRNIGDSAFKDCIKLTEITIPEGVTSIGASTFESCINLTKITIPEGVTSIGEYAFYDCVTLTEITIPESVTSIGEYAFRNCNSNINVYFGGTETKWKALIADKDIFVFFRYLDEEEYDFFYINPTVTFNYTGRAAVPAALGYEEPFAVSESDLEKTSEETSMETDVENTDKETTTESITDESSQEPKESDESEVPQESEESKEQVSDDTASEEITPAAEENEISAFMRFKVFLS